MIRTTDTFKKFSKNFSFNYSGKKDMLIASLKEGTPSSDHPSYGRMKLFSKLCDGRYGLYAFGDTCLAVALGCEDRSNCVISNFVIVYELRELAYKDYYFVRVNWDSFGSSDSNAVRVFIKNAERKVRNGDVYSVVADMHKAQIEVISKYR